MKLLLKWAIIAFSLFAAAWFVPGISVSGNGWVVYAAVAAILSAVNICIRPILKFFSFPLILLSLGLFSLVINAAMLWLTSWIAVNWFEVGFVVKGFIPAFWGSLVVSVVSGILTMILVDDKSKD